MGTIVGDWPRINAERRLERPAVVDAWGRRTWAELDDGVNGLARALLDGAGPAGRPDVVGILADNRVEHLELMFAASRASLIHTALNTRHTVEEMVRQAQDGGIGLLVVGAGYEESARRIAEAMPGLVLVGLPETGLDEQYEDWIARASREPVPSHGDHDAVYSLMYTSGSTGEPKGVMVSSRNEIAYGQSVAWTVELNHKDRVLNVAPLFHRGGQFFSMMCAQYGIPLVLSRSPATEQILEDVEREAVTHLLVVPTILKGIVEALEKEPERASRLSSLTQVMCGSAPLSPELACRLLKVLPVKLCQGAGLSEGALAMALTSHDYEDALRDERLAHRMKSVGRPSPGFRVAVVDEYDEFLPDDAVGELVYQGDAFVQGYWNKPEVSARAWRNGWFHSGDLGRRDADGYIYYVDRLYGRIKTGAETVYSREVEQVVEPHPDIVEVAVVGMPDEHWGEAVTAVVVTSRPLADDAARTGFAEEIRGFARENGLAGYKIPKRVVFVDALPRTSTAKVAFGEVKALVDRLTGGGEP